MIKIKKQDNNSLKIIASNLATLYKSGVDINNSIEIILDIISNDNYKCALKNVKENLKCGFSLGESFKKEEELFPPIFTGLISLGDYSGQLDKVLEKLSLFYSKINLFSDKIKGFLIYPKILLVALSLFFFFFILVLLPKNIELYSSSNIEMPNVIEKLYTLSNYIKRSPVNFFLSSLCYALIIYIIFKILNIKKILFKYIISKNITYTKYCEQNILFILYIVLSSGIPLGRGIESVKNSYKDMEIKNRLETILNYINMGKSLSYYFKNNNYSYTTYIMAKVGEESGCLEEKLQEALNILEDDLQKRCLKYLNNIQPLSIAIIGVFVGIMTILTLLPLFKGLQGI